jgi:hypothetical protein
MGTLVSQTEILNALKLGLLNSRDMVNLHNVYLSVRIYLNYKRLFLLPIILVSD